MVLKEVRGSGSALCNHSLGNGGEGPAVTMETQMEASRVVAHLQKELTPVQELLQFGLCDNLFL